MNAHFRRTYYFVVHMCITYKFTNIFAYSYMFGHHFTRWKLIWNLKREILETWTYKWSKLLSSQICDLIWFVYFVFTCDFFYHCKLNWPWYGFFSIHLSYFQISYDIFQWPSTPHSKSAACCTMTNDDRSEARNRIKRLTNHSPLTDWLRVIMQITVPVCVSPFFSHFILFIDDNVLAMHPVY